MDFPTPHLRGQRPTLITGITGFAGSFLAHALLQRGEDVVGLGRHHSWPERCSRHLHSIPLRVCDLTDFSSLSQQIDQIRPAQIYHLAGFASVGASYRNPFAAWEGNLTCTLNLLEAVRKAELPVRILHVGSGMVYGSAANSEHLVRECDPFYPDSPYAASKAAADLACYQYGRSGGLAIIRARPFNHIGPHQSVEFAIPSFVKQLVAIERKQKPPVLEMGNLSTERDLTDVRDMVEAYIALMQHGVVGEAYNIASGQRASMREILDRLLKLTRLQVDERQKPALLRPAEPAQIHVDTSKIRQQTGWIPRYTLEQSLVDILAAWRESP